MSDDKRALAAYLDGVGARSGYSLDRVLEAIRRSKRVCVFGIGAISYPIITALRKIAGVRIECVSDNDPAKWGQVFHGDLTCIPPSELEEFGADITVLIATRYYREIHAQLLARGIRNVFVTTEYRLLNNEYFKDKRNIDVIRQGTAQVMDLLHDDRSREILRVLVENWFDFDVTGVGYRDVFTDDQYYPPGIISLGANEAFVDGGAYDGDTLLAFVARTGGRFEAAYAFELDAGNFTDMAANVGRLEPGLQRKIRLFNLGLLDEEREIRYETGGSGKQSTCINMIGSLGGTGRTVRLVDALPREEVTFIKMDIEGSELQALHGAEAIIVDQKPQLAICVYHKPEHLWEIPLYLKKLVPGYRIFLRHHTPLEYETVCYAVPRDDAGGAR